MFHIGFHLNSKRKAITYLTLPQQLNNKPPDGSPLILAFSTTQPASLQWLLWETTVHSD